ncbi:MAG: DUF4129 domain-containing protein [Novosphingobium sp.]
MTKLTAAPSAGDDAATADAAWRAMREAGDIQFAPLAPDPPREPSPWLKSLGEFLEWLLSPLGRVLGESWSLIERLLLVAAGLVLVWLVWALVWPLWQARKARRAASAPNALPAQAEAIALLEDADRLAAQGLFAEAAHLLLRRSVGQIASARPDWLSPASTAREIGALNSLPDGARTAFATLAGLVERARYALRPLDAEDWQAARAAYARFAQVPLDLPR